MKKVLALLFIFICYAAAQAQIGYQVTLLDTATGEPRANETVNVALDITDNSGAVIYSGIESATTNDFGVLSVTVGNSTTFENANWSKFPFFVSATVDDILIGRSQILSVPIAEYAKHSGQVTEDILCSKVWTSHRGFTLTFSMSGMATMSFEVDGHYDSPISGRYYISDYNQIILNDDAEGVMMIYLPQINAIWTNTADGIFR